MEMHKSIIPYDEKKMIIPYDQSHGSPGKLTYHMLHMVSGILVLGSPFEPHEKKFRQVVLSSELVIDQGSVGWDKSSSSFKVQTLTNRNLTIC